MRHNQLKALYCVVGFAAAASQPLEARYSNWSHSSYSRNEVRPEEVVLGVVGTIAAGIGIYALGSYMEWWGAPSNEELIAQGRQYVSQVSGYNGMHRIAQRAQSDNRIYEDALYECALLKRGSENMDSYLCSLQGLINNLKSTYEKLGCRISNLERDRSSHNYDVLDRMRTVCRDVRAAQNDATVLHSYLHDHRGYFRLFEVEDQLAQKYARELSIVQQYAYNEYELSRALRTALSARNSGTFGLIQAMKTLLSDISSLDRALNGLAYNYANRVECSRSLLFTLKRVREIVVSDKEYVRLSVQYEAAEREKERLRLERERVANEQRIAAAREREAYAKEREARAREEQNRLKRQENRLKEQELYDNRAQHSNQYYYH